MTTWFTSDHHFFHENILTFKTEGGGRLRPEFDSIEQMNEEMIQIWNRSVGKKDKVYLLGDVAMGSYDRLDEVFARLNGRKRLIIGNHDRFNDPRLLRQFDKVLFWRMFKAEGFTASHVPLRDDQFRHHCVLNVHGHIHGDPDPSPCHMNVSVERTGYAPVPMDDVLSRVKNLR